MLDFSLSLIVLDITYWFLIFHLFHKLEACHRCFVMQTNMWGQKMVKKYFGDKMKYNSFT